MTRNLFFLMLQISLGAIVAHGHGDDLRNAILGIEPGSDPLPFPTIALTFAIETSGEPKDFYTTNEERINRIHYPKEGGVKISFLSHDVVGRFNFYHVPARTNFEGISDMKSINELGLILGKSVHRSGIARWGFFSSDGKGRYIFEFYVASFDEKSYEIFGLRHGVASWPN